MKKTARLVKSAKKAAKKKATALVKKAMPKKVTAAPTRPVRVKKFPAAETPKRALEKRARTRRA